MPQRSRTKAANAKRAKAKAGKAIPTYAAAMRLPEIDTFVVVDGEGKPRRAFSKNECVFVLHDGMDEDAPHADDYYKMKIRSFHQDGDRVLALGHWFYSAEELGDLKLGSRDKDLLPKLGYTEMVETDHKAVVDAACLQDLCNMHRFNDLLTTGTVITRQSWFTRLKLVDAEGKQPKFVNARLHCSCRELYSPHLMLQRYCANCSLWFDEGCCEALGNPALTQGETAAERLRAVPTMRGWHGLEDDEVEKWMTVGTGLKHELVIEHEGQVSTDGRALEEQWAEWEPILTEEYVHYVQTTRFERFRCPDCQAQI